jgi:hypothetical protein
LVRKPSLWALFGLLLLLSKEGLLSWNTFLMILQISGLSFYLFYLFFRLWLIFFVKSTLIVGNRIQIILIAQ